MSIALALIICVALVLAYPIWMPVIWFIIVAFGFFSLGIILAIGAALFFALAWCCDVIVAAYARWKKPCLSGCYPHHQQLGETHE